MSLIKKNPYLNQFALNLDLLFQILLITIILIGLWFKFLYYSNISLDSDVAAYGIYSYSIIQNHNYLFHQVFLSDTGNYVFNFLVLHFVSQLLSSYDPFYLKISYFLVFFCTMVIFSILIFYITKNRTNALLFCALFASLHSESFNSFQLMNHMDSVLFSGILLILILYTLQNSETLNQINILFLFFVSIVLIYLATYSDPYILLCITIPITISYVLFSSNKSRLVNMYIALVSISSIIANKFGNIITQNIISNPPIFMPYSDFSLKPVEQVVLGISLFFQGMTYYLNTDLYSIWNSINLANLTIAGIIGIISIAILFNFFRERKNVFFISYLFIAITTFFCFFSFTSLSNGFSSIRFLIFPLIVCLLLVSLSYNPSRKYFSFLILVILMFGIVGNYSSHQTIGEQSNQNEVELISILEKIGLKYGYADYWDSNIITYLSKFNVIVRPISIQDGTSIAPYHWLNYDDLYNYPDGSPIFILTKPNNPYLHREDLQPLLDMSPPSAIINYKDYTVFVW